MSSHKVYHPIIDQPVLCNCPLELHDQQMKEPTMVNTFDDDSDEQQCSSTTIAAIVARRFAARALAAQNNMPSGPKINPTSKEWNRHVCR